MRRIYLDHNATSPLCGAAKAALHELEEVVGNPSSIHWAGREAKKYLNLAREKMAFLLGAQESEILFTSGATESINTVLRSVAHHPLKRKILTSPLEHHATLRTLEDLEKQGIQTEFVKVDSQGRLSLEDFEKKLTSDTLLVSLMAANNEIGNLYPIQKIAELCRAREVLFHCDGAQVLGKINLNLKEIPLDYLSFSAHKFHGPKGVGGLFIRKGKELNPLHTGGLQEKGKRGGTENGAAIYAMSLALEEALKNQDQKILELRNRLEKGILARIPGVKIQGDPENRLANTTNLLFERLDGETLLLNLDMAGIAASAGAACESGSLDPSHVILAMGFSEEEAKSSIRFSLSKYNSSEEVDFVLEVLPSIVEKLRK